MRKQLLLLSLAVVALLWSGCGSTDLSLLNEVKRFEPEWMDLSEQVTDISRLLRKTETTYEEFVAFASPRVGSPEADEATELSRALADYRGLIKERDALSERFEETRKRFEEAVQAFNRWQNALMRDELKAKKAQAEFERYQQTYAQLSEEMATLEHDLGDNVESANSLVRQICRGLNSLREDEYLIDLTY